MILNLEEEAVNFIIHVLGELPTKTNAHGLLMSIQNQAQVQRANQPVQPVPQPPTE